MTDLVLIPDATKAVSAFLREHDEIAALVGRRVVTKTPKDTSTAYVRVTRLDARQNAADSADHLQGFLMQFDCYAGDTGGFPESTELGLTVRAVLHGISRYAGGDAVFSGCTIVGDIDLPDDDGFEPARDRRVITASISGHAAPGVGS